MLKLKLQYFGHLMRTADSFERTWIWVDSGSWWWTGRPGLLRLMGSQRVGHNWVNWTEPMIGTVFTSLTPFTIKWHSTERRTKSCHREPLWLLLKAKCKENKRINEANRFVKHQGVPLKSPENSSFWFGPSFGEKCRGAGEPARRLQEAPRPQDASGPTYPGGDSP